MGDQAFYMGAENAKMESAEKSAETGGHQFISSNLAWCRRSNLSPRGKG